jgi:hypothetical protein
MQPPRGRPATATPPPAKTRCIPRADRPTLDDARQEPVLAAVSSVPRLRRPRTAVGEEVAR